MLRETAEWLALNLRGVSMKEWDLHSNRILAAARQLDEAMEQPSKPKLTRRQAAILSAYTGVLCGPFQDMHVYVDSLPGFKGIMTAGLAMMAKQIEEAAKPDFLAMLPTKEDR